MNYTSVLIQVIVHCESLFTPSFFISCRLACARAVQSITIFRDTPCIHEHKRFIPTSCCTFRHRVEHTDVFLVSLTKVASSLSSHQFPVLNYKNQKSFLISII